MDKKHAKNKKKSSSEHDHEKFENEQKTEKIVRPPMDTDPLFPTGPGPSTKISPGTVNMGTEQTRFSSPAGKNNAEASAPDYPADVFFHNQSILPLFKQGDSGLLLELQGRKRFERQKKLGEGGGGEVELVRDNDIYRLVAIKRMKKTVHNPWMLKRFIDEIRVVGHLEHPNIVPIHDVGIDEEGYYYFVMKYVHGESLESVIHKLKAGNPYYHQKYTYEYRTNIFSEVLKAIEFAHHHGVIHRDIKPANIMIGPYGEVKVMDWGIAKQIRKMPGKKIPERLIEDIETSLQAFGDTTLEENRVYKTRDSIIIGTPAYMAPEQALGRNDRLDERTDIYSLCALFYELLTLQPYLPPKQSLPETLKGILEEKPKLATFVRSRHQPSVPADLGHFVKKGLAKDPRDRYQSVSELRTLLQSIQEGYMPIQCPMTLAKRSLHALIHLVNSHPVLGILTVILVGAMLVSGSLFLIYLL